MRKTTALPIALLIGSLVAACSSAPAITMPTRSGTVDESPTGQGVDPATSPVDACQLLSDQEIRIATGQDVSDRTASTLTQVFPSVCDISLDGSGSLTVSILPTGGRSLYETSFEPYIGDGLSPTLDEAVTGLGDKAGSANGDELMVLKDDVLFELLYLDFGRTDKLSVVRYLADTMLAKLPCLSDGCAGFTPLPAPSMATAIDACELLTSSEIAAATGFDASDGSPGSSATGSPRCTWALETDSALPGLDWVALEILQAGGRAKFDFWAKDGFEEPPVHVAGLGDDAIKTATIPGGYFYSVVGDTLVTASFNLPLTIEDPYQVMKPLVAQAVSRV